MLALSIATSTVAEMPAPPNLENVSGVSLEITDYDSRLRLINFWATWCAPCRVEMPDLDGLQRLYDPGQFRVIGVAADEREAIDGFLQSVPVEYPIFVGDPNEVFAWSEELGNAVVALPFSVVVDQSGSVRWVKTGGRILVDDLAPIIDGILAEKSPKPGPPIGAPNFKDAPPPLPRAGGGAKPVAAGTSAGDGIGVTMRRAPTAGAYNENSLTYVPWEDSSTIQPLPVGNPLPARSTVHDANGDEVDLNAEAERQPTILVYFRGGWCPFCNAHLRQLQQIKGELTDMGYQILAVSTDTVDAVRAHGASTNFGYSLLSDADLNLATSLGLKFKVAQEYIDHVKALPPGVTVDLVEQNGGYLVTPAAFVLDTDGVIRFAYANNNYAVRVSQDALLDAARSALQ